MRKQAPSGRYHGHTAGEQGTPYSHPALLLPPLLTRLVLTVFPLYAQEKECSRHQQELDKALESLKREKMELEARLRKQQAETEALRAQKEEEQAEAKSALCQVGDRPSNLWVPYFGPLPFPLPRAVPLGASGRLLLRTLLPVRQVPGSTGCRAGGASYFLGEG